MCILYHSPRAGREYRPKWINIPKRSCVHHERRSVFCSGVSLKICRNSEEYAIVELWKYEIMEITNVIRTRTQPFSYFHNFIFSQLHIFTILFYFPIISSAPQRLCVRLFPSPSTLSQQAARGGRGHTAGATDRRCAPSAYGTRPEPFARGSGVRSLMAAT